ncbi:MAG: hypothetical protein II230_07035, partial [Clostridia bacterium]|nr:hypothetical protein [Clostridia bacterium]
MDEIKRYLEEMITEALVKMVISNPKSKSEEYRKIVVNRKKNGFQIEKGFIEIQAEDFTYRNDSSIHATCEFDPDLYPYQADNRIMNTVDSTSF